MATRLVILDRDGVINHDSDEFVKSADEWLPIDGSLDAIGRLVQAGFTVAVATNQSGIGRGLMTRSDLERIHDKMSRMVQEAGGAIDLIAYCPHHPDDGCDCRKPLPGLLQQVAGHYGAGLGGVPVIGDSLRDLEAAAAVSARPILVLTGNGVETEQELGAGRIAAETFADLAAAADQLIVEAR